MSYKLVIAEKPSVAQSITKVIGADKREDRYLEGNRKLKERRSTGRVATADGADTGRTRPERQHCRSICYFSYYLCNWYMLESGGM